MEQCERCGESNPPDASYCATCGRALADPSAVSALVGEPDADDGPSRTSESVAPPAFGETTTPGAIASSDDLAPTAPSVAAGPSNSVPAPTAVIGSSTYGDTSGPPRPPSSESSSTGVMIAALAIVVVVVVGGLFVLLASNSGGDDAATTVVTTLSDDVIDAVQPSSSVEEVAPPPTGDVEAPVTLVASTEPPATAPPTPPPTSAPSPPVTPVPGTGRAVGDLGLDQPILDEACDGRYITFVGSAVGAQPYADEVDSLLGQYPGSNYIWTRACPSLRQEFRDGNDIYGVVFGPYLTQQEACDAVSFGPPDAYVRRISTTDPEDHTVDC